MIQRLAAWRMSWLKPGLKADPASELRAKSLLKIPNDVFNKIG
jgi:hypothetical protein